MSHETPPAVRSEAAAPYAAAGPPPPNGINLNYGFI